MKKLNFLLMAAAGLALASCSQDELNPSFSNGGGNVHFTVSLPSNSVSSRAIGDGFAATDLSVLVYDVDDTSGTPEYSFVMDGNQTFPTNNLSTTVDLDLVTGKSYKIVFFAYSPAAMPENETATDPVYSIDSETGVLTVNYAKMNSDDNLADDYGCFYGTYTTGPVGNNAGINANVTLTRPVAQINWGTTGFGSESISNVATVFGENGKYIVTSLAVSAYTTLDMLNDTYDGQEAVTLLDFATPNTLSTVPAFPGNNGTNTYNYMAMQYVLAPSETSATYDLVLTVQNNGEGNEGDYSNEITVSNAPVQANYQTNIYGSLLSSHATFTVTKSAAWGENSPYEIVYIDGQPYVKINSSQAENLSKGGNYILDEDINYTGGELLFTKDANINLNDNSLTSEGSNYGDAIGVQGANVTLSDGIIKSAPGASAANASATIIVQGATKPAHLTLNNVTITDAPGFPILMTSQNTESTITINSGTYCSLSEDGPAVRVGANKTTTTAGKVTINGGTFGKTGVNNPFLLNVMDNISSGKDPRDFIEVFGGTFINFNPAANAAEGNPTNFVAEGYQVITSTVGSDTYYTVVPGTAAVATSTAELSSAIQNAADGATIYITGTVQLPNTLSGKELTFKGMGVEATTIDAQNAYWSYENCNVNFEDMTMVSFVNPTNHTSMGFQNAANQTYTNVKFDGEFHVFTGNATFNNCQFVYEAASQTNYQLWCQTSGTVNINNCSMTCNNAKAILVYGWPGSGSNPPLNTVGGDININGLTVTNNTSNDKAVVEIHSELYTKAGTININNVTYPDTFQEGLWQEIYNVKPYEGDKTTYYKIIVNGKTEQEGGFEGTFTGSGN